MAFEDYKELEKEPEKATVEEIKELAKKYGIKDFFEERPKGILSRRKPKFIQEQLKEH